MDRLYFVGPGRTGLALGHALWQADTVERLTYCGRRPEPPSHPLFIQGVARYVFGLERPEPDTTAVFLTVPDDVLPEIAVALAGHGDAPTGCCAFHCSGALSADVLAPLHARGYRVGSIHPLQSLAHPVSGADRLPGSGFAVSGEHEATALARRMVATLGGVPLEIPVSRRPLYHAAAVTASNYVTALVAMAGRLLVQAGVAEDEALRALLPLARGTLENIGEMGVLPSLTGPIQRGDVETVRLHLRALEPREGAVYAAMGREMVTLASAFGLPEDVADRILDALENESGAP